MTTSPSEKAHRSNSLQAMGLKAFVDETRPNQGGFAELDRRFRDGESNTKIGKHFGRTRQQIGNWREMWEKGEL